MEFSFNSLISFYHPYGRQITVPSGTENRPSWHEGGSEVAEGRGSTLTHSKRKRPGSQGIVVGMAAAVAVSSKP